MTKDYSAEDIKKQKVNESRAQYVASHQGSSCTVNEDELVECITLEEWETELTKIIHEHYQFNHESHSQPHCKN
jgi:hypothetical protein